jgi:hypothetical protein
MDQHIVIPLAGMLTSIIGTVAISWAVVQGIRIRNQPRIGERETALALAELEERVDRLQRELVEAHERIDFTERLLARGDDSHGAGG